MINLASHMAEASGIMGGAQYTAADDEDAIVLVFEMPKIICGSVLRCALIDVTLYRWCSNCL